MGASGTTLPERSGPTEGDLIADPIIVTVKVGVLGLEAEGIGTEFVEIELPLDGTIGRPLASGFRKALLSAVKEFQPLFIEHMQRSQGD